MTTFRSAQVAIPGGPFELVEQDLAEPGPSEVRLVVEACGICHADAGFVHGHFPGVPFPLVTGHEIAGRVDAVGEGAQQWAVGQRVAVGWFGGHCGHCAPCRGGDFIHCFNLKVPGWAYPGGYSEVVVAPSNALAQIPPELSAVEAAPMGCAGVTVFNALRRSGAMPGDVVAILGIGGVGHLGIQFAAKMGFETVAIARGGDKQEAATQLGAHHYIDSRAENVSRALQALGGARVVLATAANADAMTSSIDGLTHLGELIVIGAVAEDIAVSPLQLIMGSKTIHGHPSGTARDVEETLKFAALTGIRPVVEQTPLEDAGAAFDRMLSGAARFRMVLTTGR